MLGEGDEYDRNTSYATPEELLKQEDEGNVACRGGKKSASVRWNPEGVGVGTSGG